MAGVVVANKLANGVEGLKTLYWSPMQCHEKFFHTLEVQNPIGFITLILQRSETGISDLCG